MTIPCPSCSKSISTAFRPADCDVVVCPKCHTASSLSGKTPLPSGVIPEDFSYIKIGTRFTWNGFEHTIEGRIRIQLRNEYLNIWSASSANGNLLLAESFDSIRILTTPWNQYTGDVTKIRVGKKLKFGEVIHYGEFIDVADSFAAEGVNLPLPFYKEFFLVQFGSSASDVSLFTLTKSKECHYLQGQKTTASKLQFQNLRTEYSTQKTILTCSKCKSDYEARGKALTISWVCPSCKTYYHVYGKKHDAIQLTTDVATPAIPLGSKGLIDGDTYEVMGFVVKEETVYHYKWREYLLFNPLKGFAFLSEYDGHWMFVWPFEDFPDLDEVVTPFEGEMYRLYQKNYQGLVVYAEGEFFFDVIGQAEITMVTEAIAPPYLVGVETSEDFILGYKAEYISPKEVATAFQIPNTNLPKAVGTGLLQPSLNVKMKDVITLSIVLAGLLTLSMIVMATLSTDKLLYQKTYFKSDVIPPDSSSTAEIAIVLPSFTLDKGPKNITFDMMAPLDNDWFFSQIALINETTGEVQYFEKELDYYYGVTDGESWTEGSKTISAHLSKVAAGKYHFNLYPKFGTAVDSFTVEVRTDVFDIWNYIYALLLLGTFPIIMVIAKNNIERKRWADSDYSPYDS